MSSGGNAKSRSAGVSSKAGRKKPVHAGKGHAHLGGEQFKKGGKKTFPRQKYVNPLMLQRHVEPSMHQGYESYDEEMNDDVIICSDHSDSESDSIDGHISSDEETNKKWDELITVEECKFLKESGNASKRVRSRNQKKVTKAAVNDVPQGLFIKGNGFDKSVIISRKETIGADVFDSIVEVNKDVEEVVRSKKDEADVLDNIVEVNKDAEEVVRSKKDDADVLDSIVEVNKDDEEVVRSKKDDADVSEKKVKNLLTEMKRLRKALQQKKDECDMLSQGDNTDAVVKSLKVELAKKCTMLKSKDKSIKKLVQKLKKAQLNTVDASVEDVLMLAADSEIAKEQDYGKTAHGDFFSNAIAIVNSDRGVEDSPAAGYDVQNDGKENDAQQDFFTVLSNMQKVVESLDDTTEKGDVSNNKELAQLKAENIRLQYVVNKMSGAQKNADHRYDRMSEKKQKVISRKREKINSLEDTLWEMELENSAYKKKYENLLADQNSKDGDKLNVDLSSISSQNSKDEEAISPIDNKGVLPQDTKSKKGKVQKKNKALKIKKVKSERKCRVNLSSEMANDIEFFESRNIQLERRIDELGYQNGILKNEVESLEERNLKLRDELKSSEGQNELSQASIFALQTLIADQNEDICNEREKNQEFDRHISKLEQSVIALEVKSKQLKLENAEMQQKMKQIINDLNAPHNDNIASEDVSSNLKVNSGASGLLAPTTESTGVSLQSTTEVISSKNSTLRDVEHLENTPA